MVIHLNIQFPLLIYDMKNTLKNMNKPKLKKQEYYDWDESWDYIKDKYGFVDNCAKDGNDGETDLWGYFCDKYEIHNGSYLILSDWELKHNGGEFRYMVPEWYIPILNSILDEFGSVDVECLTPNIRTATFWCSW